MSSQKQLSLETYYKSFKSISGGLAIATGLARLISLVAKPLSSILFPPLGDATIPALAGLIILYAATTYIAYCIPGPNLRVALMVISVCTSCASLYLYVGDYLEYVRKVNIPSLSSSVRVSVGLERSDFAKEVFKTESDWDMLRGRGTDDEAIWQLWTNRSIVDARLSLFRAFCGFLIPLVLVFSLGVRNQFSDPSPSSPAVRLD